MSSKFAIENENVLQLLGDFVPQTPSLVQFKNFIKKALLHTHRLISAKSIGRCISHYIDSVSLLRQSHLILMCIDPQAES